jgi:hypothetical protein
MDLNHDTRLQRPVSCRWTTPQLFSRQYKNLYVILKYVNFLIYKHGKWKVFGRRFSGLTGKKQKNRKIKADNKFIFQSALGGIARDEKDILG